jgi:amino acid adenylation domain-containing protein/non-ribosomal peptide synthase protein (TIGR01720 family)
MRLPFVHEMFAQVAERHPDLVAIESAHGRLTYRELHTKASLVAASIALAGGGRNDLVVIFGDDRQFIIESILGVLKAGAAFVPLSRTVPPKRLETMLAQCSPQWAIVQPDWVHEFEPIAAASSLNVISMRDAVCASRDGTGGQKDLDGDDLSYIFFTSGSTGKPKAIAGRRKAVDHFIRWEIETFGLGPGSRVSQLMSPMFDAFMRDIFAPLCSGGTVCIPEDNGGVPDGVKLGKWIGEAGINLVHAVPSVFRLILNQTNGSGRWKDLHYVLLSGEPLLPADVRKWHEVAGRDAGRLVNLYGPTETTMTKFVYMVEPADQWKKTIPIGKPMRGAKAVVVDKNGRVCPPWRVGELYIRTPYRSLGYFGQPELTNAVFVPNPFNNDAADLVYKTGDLARIVDNGDFEVLGRRDNQVKIRGVRIEIEEIEAALAECEGLSQAAVAVRDEPDGDKRLVAYIVPEPGVQLTATGLRKSLKDKLPEYMLPAAWGLLQKLPLTPTGKVDRQALEKIKPESLQDKHEGEAASTQTEEILCGIWSQVLKLESVGVHDNFFEVGGHSLLATQLMSRIQDAFSLELPLRVLFESPTIAELARSIEQVGQQKLGMELPTPLRPVEGVASLPLSYAQQRLWFIDQLEPGGTSYNVYGAVEIEGPLDPEQLKRSLQEIVRRHESLRTRFISADGGPQQVIDVEPGIGLPVVDLSSLPANEREPETRRLVQSALLEPFDLTTGPLLRVKLLRLEEQRHVLLLVMHHIISDGWSVGLLEHEVSALYGAFVAGQPSPLPELPIQYADFSVWQKKYLNSEVLEKKLEYWKQQLAGLETLELPTDRPRPVVKTTNGASIALNLPADLTGQLRDLARQEATTLYMLLLAACQVLLFRYTDQADVAVGSPVAGRTRSETESLIGCFINTLVLRTDLSGDPAFTQLMRRIKEVTLDAFAHQDVPFEKLVETLQPERNLARTPLFQVLFVLQNAPRSDLQFGAAKVRPLAVETSTTKFDLTLVLGETPSGIAGLLQYNTDLFDAATVERMAAHYQTLLAGIVSGPERNISELPLLGEAESRQLLVGYNQTSQPWPRDAYVHGLIEQQAARTPKAVAVEHEGSQLTYAELSSRSNQLARYLLELGVVPETRVGIYMERSAEMIIGLLAVLKAGGAYVPLDPTYPAERVGHMLEDGQVSVVLTRASLVNRLPSCGCAVNLDAEEQAISSQSTDQVEGRLCPENLAYIIYTSGSTGKAKGVGVSHENLWISTLARTHYYHDPVKGYLLLSSFSFDSSVAGIFWTLIHGGALILPGEDVHGDAIGLAKLIIKTNASHLLALPALYELILEAGSPLTSLKVAIVAGESCSVEVVASHRRNVPNALLVNEYGPTEATVWCTAWSDEQEQLQGRIPIGRPIPGAKVYVLDRKLAPAPQGVVGELYVAGKGLTRGYVEHPDLTADRFIPNPFSEEPGERLYRTGDLVRWNANQNLEYLGRSDEQIKLRGFRIELGDIESVLRQHPAVADVAVVLREGNGGKRLVAYLVLANAMASSHAELRKYLSQKLPDYMIPTMFVALEKLPVTPNGKIDRKSLPEPERDGLPRGYAGPRDAIEQALCGILENLLGLERVGVDDNFFELGGHSLLATQVMSQVRNIFQVELPLRALFEAPTVAGLAERLRATRGVTHKAGPSLVRVEPRENLPLSYAQQRLWFLDQLEPGNVAYNAPLGVRLEGVLDKESLRWSINEIIRRHEVLRTGFASHNGKAVQEIVPELQLQVEEIDLSELAAATREEEAQRLAQAEVETPFDLARAPLLRAKLLRLREQDHVLLVTLHHIVSDGWSMGIIVREFMQLYEARAKGEESPLVQPLIQYADFAAWQREWLQGELLEEQLGYWRNQLAGMESLNLPVDYRRESVLTRKGDLIPFHATFELAQQLQRLGRQNGVTLFMALLAALQVTLSKHAGQQDVAVGTAVANRNRSEIEGLVGFFVNTLVMRTQLDTSWTFAQLLQQVRQVALDAYQHQDVPFERLVDELQPERDLSRSALFQVMLVLQNIPQEQLQLPRLRLSGFAPAVEAPKFDLMLTLGEGATGISGSLSYSSDLFERATVESLLEHLKLVLQAMVEKPDQRIAELSLLTPVERQTVLVDWNETTVEYPSKYIPELFAKQVVRNPGATAVRYEGKELTYKELNVAANRIAYALSKRGVGPESLVGVCLDRSLELVAALLGVLKAGAGYVPLDPNYPVERLRYMINDSRVALVLSSAPAIEKLSAIGCEAWKIEDLLAVDVEEESEVNAQVCGDHPAYVIYTSGSTGQPKGVMLTYSSLQNHMGWMLQLHPLGPEDRVLQKTVFTFDASVWEFYAPLLAGSTLVMARPGGHQDPEYLVQCLQEERITILQLVPLQLRLLLEQNGLARCHSLKRVYCGGEALSRDQVRAFYQQAPWAKLYNLYGPTEATIDATIGECSSTQDSDSAPIGKPISNTQVYVLGQGGEAVPVGTWGELYIGGAALGRGYLHRPELTAENFVPNPFSAKAGERLYRSGDQARWLPNGNLEFLGRLDHQVKFRGHRLELGEISAALLQHPDVEQAVVVIREDRGDKSLVAYFVAGRTELSRSELRRYLQTLLPEYAVPSEFVQLEELPLLPNGKINRQALPAPATEQIEDETYVAPRSPVEEILCGIWAKLLNVERVGIHDNFFELGGDSILGIQVVAQAREAGVNLTARQMFEHQTVAALAELAGNPGIPADGAFASDDGLRDKTQRAEVQRLLKAEAKIEDIYPLSSMQQGMLFHSLYEPGSKVYLIQLMCHISGGMEPAAFRRAWEDVVRRHSILRTAVLWEGLEKPLQAVHQSVNLPWREEDWRDLSKEAQEEKWQNFLREDQELGFDFQKAPLMRLAMMRTGDESYYFAWSFHHVLIDGWCRQVLVKEVFSLYEAYREGRQLELNTPPPYRNYIAWLQKQDESKAEVFWREELKGFTSPTHLGIEQEGLEQGVTQQRHGEVTTHLAPELTRQLERFGKATKVTQNTIVQGAWALLLSRHSGEEDVLFGATVSGRSAPVAGIESMMGLFINTLPVRITARNDEATSEFLRRLQARQAEVREYEYSPLAKMQSWSEVRGMALFNTLVVFENYPVDSVLRQRMAATIAIDTLDLIDLSNYPLSLVVHPGDELVLSLAFDRAVFDQESVDRLLKQFCAILTQIASEDDLQLRHISLLSAEDRKQILFDWNSTDAALPPHSVQRIFEDQVLETPDAVAVEVDGQRLTYRELNQRANQLASFLLARGVGAETLVGISVERSFAMVVGVLGILKAGGAYVPLDAAYPRERLDFMLKDTGAQILLTQESLLGQLPEFDGQLVCLDRDWEQINQESDQNPDAFSSSDNLAYVMYTSGSTGRPKGIAITHQAIVRLVINTNYVQLGQSDRIAQVASTSFDAATFEVWGALLNGACLVVLDRETSLNPGKLEHALRAGKITIMFLTTALFNQMARESKDVFGTLRCLLFGGEAVDRHRVESVLQGDKPQHFLHVYGPTEMTTFSTYYPIGQIGKGTVPIGGPISNTEVYVLDEHMEPVPAGVTGELYAGGAGLARGYLNRAELTAEKFVPNPFGQRPGARLYRTGDRVRWRADGNIEFIGRQDNQVKMRGFRIELGEIEVALEKLAEVEQAAVLMREDEFGNKQLVAYIVTHAPLTKAQLREALSLKLPQYMVPSSFVMLDSFPLTPNGKVDRKALPEPTVDRGTEEASYVAPRNDVEAILCGIWAKLLKVERVGVHDNFFELGGDSILSIQVIGRAREAGVQLTPRQIFECQTIAELVEVAGVTASVKAGTDSVWSANPVPLTPIQAAFFQWRLADPGYYNQAVMLELKPDVDSALVKQVLGELLQQHEVLRMKYEQGDQGSLQLCKERAPEDFYENKDFSALDESDQKVVLELDADRVQASLDLEAGRLVAAVEYELGTGKNKRLLLVIHHLVVDGVSWRILLADLERGYELIKNGQAPSFGKTTSFRKWSEWVRQYGSEEQLKQEMAYWCAEPRRKVKPLPKDLELAGTQDDTTEDLQTVVVSLEEQETRELLQEVPRIYHTQINDVLLTALGRVCAEWTGGRQVLVDLEGHGREEVLAGMDLSETVGWFTSIYPVLLEVDEDWEAGKALKQTKEQLRRVPNRGFGYGVLRYVTGDDAIRRQLAELPQSEISFNYLGQFDQVFRESKLFRPAQEGSGRSVSRENHRQHVIDVGGMVANGRLQIGWTYNANVARRESIEKVAQQYVSCLREIIDHCRSEHAGGHTPSDFPLAGLSQQEVDRVIGKGIGIEDVYGMSAMQQGLLFHGLYEAGSSMHFLQLACHIRRGIVPAAFRRAWEEVVRRHAILRTAFLWEGLEQSVQVVHERVEVPWLEQDWRELPVATQREKWEAFLKQDRDRGFDFRKAPLMRLALIRTGEESYYFAWSTHHILMDGWCRPPLIGEVFNVYKAYREGKEPAHKRVPAYREYIAWLQRQNEEKAEAFWRADLGGFAGSHDLGVKLHKRELEKGEERFGEKRGGIGRELTERLEKMAREQQVTLNTVMLGAWARVLASYTGYSDVIFGTTVSGRPAELPGIESMIGLFINTLPTRVQIKSEETVASYLQRLQKRQVELRDYEYSPLPKVQAWSDMPRGVRLFESLFVFENYPAETAMERQVDSSLQIDSVLNFDVTNYPLSLVAVPAKDMVIVFKYDRTLFDHETIERVFDHLRTVLEQMAAAADEQVEKISLLTPEQQQLLAKGWSSAVAADQNHQSVPRLVATHAERSPQAVSLIAGGKQLSYGELNRRANQLAHYLHGLGLKLGKRAAICLDQDFNLMTALLGVLKTGAAFFIVKADEPTRRITGILEDADASVIITEQHLQHLFERSSALVLLDEHQEQIERQSDCELDVPVDADSLACLLYHSSPDGTPHGTLVPHRSLRSGTFASELTVGAGDRVAHTLDFAHDGTCFEVFSSLVSGACVVSIPRQSLPPRKLAEFLREQRVTVLVTTSAVFAPTASQFPLAFKRLRLVLIKDPFRLADSLAQTLPAQALERVYGVYGYSEAGGPCVLYPLRKLVDGGAFSTDFIAAGRKIYLLDSQLEPAPVGVLGEIYLSGEGVSLGYEKQPRRNAQTFVSDPFATTPGTRMYRTGDVARRTAEGSLEFGPRTDGRLTINGQRVETKEVEIVLGQHEGIQETAVMAQETSDGNIALSAVLVAEGDYAIDIEGLRTFAVERLPESMVPLNFTPVDVIPRTPRGEVDAQALAAKLRRKKDEGPRNEVERVLAAIWARLLKREPIGIHDNFFELGGDSILSIQVVTQAQDAGVHITPRQLFERPTIAELAEVAGTRSAETEADQGTITGPMPLTPIQTAFFGWNLAKPAHFNQAVLLELTPGADSKQLEHAVLALPQQHDALRMRFAREDTGWVQSGELEAPQDIYQRRDLSKLQEREQRAALESDANLVHASLDLHRGLLMRAVEYDLGGTRGKRLLLVIHHLVVDGVSWPTLLADLERAYEQLAQGQPVNLGFKTTSYKRWSEALRQYCREDQVKQELAYWCSEPRKNVGVLPRDYSQVRAEDNTVDTLRGVTMTLEIEETRELLQDIPSVYNTQINDVLLTVAGQVFGEWTGTSHVLVDLEGHGREDLSAGIDLSRTVGWFTTLYPVLLAADQTGQWRPGEALSATKEQLRAVPSRGLGYGLLRYVSDDAETQKQFQQMPRAEIIFNYLGQLDALIGEPRLFKLALESSGKAAAGENRRTYVLDVNAMVVQGKLQVNWGYSEKLHRRDTIENLARRYMQCLREVIAHCRSEEAGGFTPSDFPAANNMTQDELMQIGSLLSK